MDIYPSSARPPELETTRLAGMLARARSFVPRPKLKMGAGCGPCGAAILIEAEHTRPPPSSKTRWPRHKPCVPLREGHEHRSGLSQPYEVCHRHGRRRLRPRQRSAARRPSLKGSPPFVRTPTTTFRHHDLEHRAPAQVRGPARDVHQDRPLPEHGRGDDVAVRARRDVRARRRRRDGPGPGQLRAVPRPEPHAGPQHHDGQGLRQGAREGAQGRLPGQDRAGRAARHPGDPGLDRARRPDPDGRPRGPAGRLPRRGRRHRRRHRVVRLPRGAPLCGNQIFNPTSMCA